MNTRNLASLGMLFNQLSGNLDMPSSFANVNVS